MLASKITIMKKVFEAIISVLRRKMQFRNRLSRPESHVRIEECNFEKSFYVRIEKVLLRQNCIEECNFEKSFFASKNAILTKAFEARIVFLHRRFKNVNFEGGC